MNRRFDRQPARNIGDFAVPTVTSTDRKRRSRATAADPPQRPPQIVGDAPMVAPGRPGEWVVEGACYRTGDTRFFDETEKGRDQAKRICAGCPVMADCRAHGIAHEKAGVWGGLDEDDRLALRRQARMDAGIRARAEAS